MNGKASQTVAMADDVAAALRAAGLVEVFERLPVSHRQEYLTWIDAARQAATRARRVGGMVERLKGR